MILDYRMGDWLKCIRSSMDKKGWITVYEQERSDYEQIYRHCALVEERQASNILDSSNWDLRYGMGMPGYTKHFDGRVEYNRFSCCEPVEPLIYSRSFPDDHQLDFLEISEEFRHFYNLYYDEDKRTYNCFDEDGDPVEVIRLLDNKRIEIHAKYLKEFLAVKEMFLVLYFEIMRYSKLTMAAQGLKGIHKSKCLKYLRYDINIYDYKYEDWQFISSIIGKKIIAGLKNHDISHAFESRNQLYENFIIGVDNNGQPIKHTSNFNLLRHPPANRRNIPSFYQPVYFKRIVLSKYYNTPDRYEVHGLVINCGGKWSLQIDNDRKDCVVAQLGKLGMLPISEQKHWASHNIEPKNGLSGLAFLSWIQGKFGEPEMGDILFKDRFWRFQKRWREKSGWDLFKPLKAGDEHFLKTLRIPLIEDQKEFDDQVLALAKILIESLNEKEIARKIKKNQNDKGITKLQKYLETQKMQNTAEHIQFLRNLRDLRDGVGHRKGEKYKRGFQFFNISEKGFIDGFDDILKRAIYLLQDLADFFRISIKSNF